MDSRMLLTGIVSLSVVIGLGYAIGRWTAPDRGTGDPDGEENGEPQRASADDLVAELEQELARQERRKETLEHELYGAPIPWPDDTPAAFSPAGFEQNLRAAVAACAPDVAIVGVECSEPPCLALLRVGDDGWRERLIDACPGWTDHYGSSVASSTGSLACPGGVEHFTILAPPARSWLPDDDETRSALPKRHQQRTDEARLRWVCAAKN